jgi:hypothetical protein
VNALHILGFTRLVGEVVVVAVALHHCTTAPLHHHHHHHYTTTTKSHFNGSQTAQYPSEQEHTYISSTGTVSKTDA